MDFNGFSDEPTSNGELATHAAPAVENGGGISSHGWQKVTSSKRTKRHEAAARSRPTVPGSDPSNGPESRVFQALEKEAEQKRTHREALLRAFHDGQAAFAVARPPPLQSDSDMDDDAEENPRAPDGELEEKPKTKKTKKPKVTVAEAASAIDPSDLAAFLTQISESFAELPDVQLMRFADYFGRAFNLVTPPQFGWNKILKESSLSKAVEVPLCYVNESVIKTASDWLAAKPLDALGGFVIWGLNDVLNDMQPHQSTHKGSKGTPTLPSKTKVGVLVVIALTLRKRPEVLLQKAAVLRTSQQFQGQEKLMMLAWAYGQVAQGDLVVGMQVWVQNLLPLACGKASTPAARDVALQFAESILFTNLKKARPILQNGASRKGERLVPPSALNSLMHSTFPSAEARTKATERFEGIYPVVKELALAGPRGSKAIRAVAQQLLPLCLESACEDVPTLIREACDMLIWCLSENTDCFKQWEKLHLEKLKGSIKVLSYMCNEWRVVVDRLNPLDDLKNTVSIIRVKNHATLENAKADPKLELMLKTAEKHLKVLKKRLARTGPCFKTMATLVAGASIAYGFYLLNFDIPLLR